MNKILLLVVVGILSVSVEGCSLITEFFNANNQEETETNSANQNNDPAQNSESQANQSNNQETANKPKEPLVEQEVAGLIPATNPEVRVRGSIRGRQDPFAPVAVQPRIIVEQEEPEENTQQEITEANEDITSTPIIDSLNDEPNAVLAEGVRITGVVDVGGVPKVIVQAPEENSSRYVEVGQYIANGQVLIKQVDLNHVPAPLVILEQNGIEVAKLVGESGEEDAPSEEQALNNTSERLFSSKTNWVSNFLSQKLNNGDRH